jgi:hypothetical protein
MSINQFNKSRTMFNMVEKQVAEKTTIFQGENSGFQVGNNYGQITVQKNSLLGKFSENYADLC